jgi:hypothetical protein
MKFDFGTQRASITAARERLDALETSQMGEGCRLLFEKLMVPDIVKKLSRFKRSSLVTTLSQLNPSHTLTPCSFNHLKPEEERDHIKWGGPVADKFSPILKVPSQCPLVLLIEALLTEDKASGSEEGKEFELRLYYVCLEF